MSPNIIGETGVQCREIRIAGMQCTGRAIGAHDQGPFLKAAPHQRHADDLGEMAGRLVAGTGQATPDDGVGTQHAQTVHPHGGNIDGAFCGSSAAEEHVLRFDELAVAFRDFIELLCDYSTVTDFARLRGWSTSVPLATAV